MSHEHAVSMPRRVVLSSAVMASGSLLLRPRCLWAAGASELPALSFIVVSDTHLGYHDQPRAALYNLDRQLEAQHAPGHNPPEFRPGYTLVTLQKGEMRLAYKPVGAPVAVHHACRLPSTQ